MKRLFFIFLLIFAVSSSAFAVDKAKILEIKIVSEIVGSLTNKKYPKVCFYNFYEYEKRQYKQLSNLKITQCKNADIMLVKGLEKKIKFNKPAFALDYLSFRNCENCIGAFYWRKGRPQIILIKENLDMYKIKINGDIKIYVISKRIAEK